MTHFDLRPPESIYGPGQPYTSYTFQEYRTIPGSGLTEIELVVPFTADEMAAIAAVHTVQTNPVAALSQLSQSGYTNTPRLAPWGIALTDRDTALVRLEDIHTQVKHLLEVGVLESQFPGATQELTGIRDALLVVLGSDEEQVM